MPLWSHIAAGCADTTRDLDDLRRELERLLADPRYGTGLAMLDAGPERERQPA